MALSQCLALEQEFAQNIGAMMRRGVAFDEPFARRESELRLTTLRGIEDELDQLCGRRQVPTKTPAFYFDPARPGDRRPRKKDFDSEPLTVRKRLEPGPVKVKEVLFNPNSGQHITSLLQKRYGWKPVAFTEGGAPSTTAEVLSKLPYTEAELILHWKDLSKTLEYVATGKSSYLECLADDGRIHGYVNHMGAVTSRCTHSRPNTANVPRRKSAAWARQCFIASPGMVLIGSDASGLELAMLANALAPFDGGRYVGIMADPSSDKHAQTVEALQTDDRDQAKTFTYAHNYGAGDAKLGAILGFEDDDEIRRFARTHRELAKKAEAKYRRRMEAEPPWYFGAYSARGALAREQFVRAFDGLDLLLDSIAKDAKAGYMLGLDGRHVPVRSPHAALNTALQSGGAILVKLATNLACRAVRAFSGGMVLHVHDEFQFEANPEHAEELAAVLAQTFTDAGEELGLACPVFGESKVGRHWGETH